MAALNVINLVHEIHPRILGGIEVGYEKVAVQSIKPEISLKMGKKEQYLGLLLTAYKKSRTRYRF